MVSHLQKSTNVSSFWEKAAGCFSMELWKHCKGLGGQLHLEHAFNSCFHFFLTASCVSASQFVEKEKPKVCPCFFVAKHAGKYRSMLCKHKIRWPTTVTAIKELTSRQKEKPHGKKKKTYGKKKNLTAKRKRLTAKRTRSRQKKRTQGKKNNLDFTAKEIRIKIVSLFLLPWAELFILRRDFLFAVSLFLFAVRFFFLPWGFSLCRESYSFCREVFLFAVRLFFLPWVFFFLPWGYSFCRESFSFCREVILFAVSLILFAVRFFFLPWGFSFCRVVFLFAVRFFFLPWQLWATVNNNLWTLKQWQSYLIYFHGSC